MLTLTDNARTAIQALTAPTDEAPTPGLRIAAAPGADLHSADLDLDVAATPAPGDSVVEDEGARVFLDAAAAQALDGQTLDVQIDSDAQQVQFFLA